MIELMVRVREVTVTRKNSQEEKMKLGLLAKKKEEEEKRLCEKKRGPEASLNKHRRVKIYKFPIMPFNQFTDITTAMVAIIVSKLYQWQIFIPTVSKIHYTHSQYILECLNHPLRLTIRLRMKSSAKIKFGTQCFLFFLSKL